MLKPLVIYHANCADGFGAAFAAWLKLGESDSIEEGAEYVPMQYGTVPDIESWHMQYAISQREVYILDFSFPRQTMDYLFSVARRVTWLDHHASAFKEHGFTPNAPGEPAVEPLTHHHVVLDNNKSGAMLAWEYFHPGEEIPQLIRHIDDRDRWQFKMEGTKELNAALCTAPWNFQQWKELNESDLAPMYKAGKAILRAHDQNVQSVVKGAARNCSIVPAVIDSVESYKSPWVWWNDPEHGDTCGANGLAANCPPHLTSDVGHELANQSGTFGLCWTLGQSGTVAKCSLRSNGEYAVSAIARTFGGGGHRNAAGFEVDIQTLLGWLK